jgi:hypothetical protein
MLQENVNEAAAPDGGAEPPPGPDAHELRAMAAAAVRASRASSAPLGRLSHWRWAIVAVAGGVVATGVAFTVVASVRRAPRPSAAHAASRSVRVVPFAAVTEAPAAPRPAVVSPPAEAPDSTIARPPAMPRPRRSRTTRPPEAQPAVDQRAAPPAEGAPPEKVPLPPAPDSRTAVAISSDGQRELDDLLREANDGTESRGEKAQAKAEPPPPLTRQEIAAAMKTLAPRLADCHRQHGQAGVGHLAVKVAASGAVEGVTVEGALAGSPTGECVKDAVEVIRFPPSAGVGFRYPFAVK